MIAAVETYAPASSEAPPAPPAQTEAPGPPAVRQGAATEIAGLLQTHFAGRIALVTGSGHGLGKVIADAVMFLLSSNGMNGSVLLPDAGGGPRLAANSDQRFPNR